MPMMRLLWLMLALIAGSACADPELLEPEKAFRFSAQALDGGHIEVRYRIASGYYMYRDKLRFEALPDSVRLGEAQLPPGQIKQDEFFGKVETYRGDLRVVLPVTHSGQAPHTVLLKVTSQGCADAGVCYLPQTSEASLKLAALNSESLPKTSVWESPGPVAATDRKGLDAAGGIDESAGVALLRAGSFWLIVLGFFGSGLVLALTPCVFPMIPILSGLIVGQGRPVTRAWGLALSVAYVLGMAITYALAGVAAGLSGDMLAGALQNSWVLGGFAVLMVLLALSMFGLYELQLPVALQSRLAQASNRFKGGHLAGVFAMGALSALIVGPCVAAPLAGALLYISHTRDIVLGGSALFSMAIGMGVPLLAVGLSAGVLPRSGAWMESVKKFFGVLLLGVAIWMIAPVIPVTLQMFMWAALFIVSAIYLRAIDPLPAGASGLTRLFKGIGVVALLIGALMLAGALSGGRDVLQPLGGLRLSAGAPGAADPGFQRIGSLAELNERIGAAGGKPLLLDFYADWCVSCKEMEKFTFPDPAVQARLKEMVLLQADVTAASAEHKQLLSRFRLFGPPGIIFFDRHGGEIPDLRVIGYLPPARFAAVLAAALTR